MKETLFSFLLVLVLTCSLAPAAAQGPTEGTLPSSERLPLWEHYGRSLEGQA